MKTTRLLLVLGVFALGCLCGYFVGGSHHRGSFTPLTARPACPHCRKVPQGVKAIDGIEAVLTGTCPHCGKVVERPCPHCGEPVPVE